MTEQTCGYVYDDPYTGEIIDHCQDPLFKDGFCE